MSQAQMERTVGRWLLKQHHRYWRQALRGHVTSYTLDGSAIQALIVQGRRK